MHDPVYRWTRLPIGEIRFRRRPRKYTAADYATNPRANPNLQDRPSHRSAPVRTPPALIRC